MGQCELRDWIISRRRSGRAQQANPALASSASKAHLKWILSPVEDLARSPIALRSALCDLARYWARSRLPPRGDQFQRR
jgi:hypothetical protein